VQSPSVLLMVLPPHQPGFRSWCEGILGAAKSPVHIEPRVAALWFVSR
jgi:hypothetical protein